MDKPVISDVFYRGGSLLEGPIWFEPKEPDYDALAAAVMTTRRIMTSPKRPKAQEQAPTYQILGGYQAETFDI